ncbi:Vsp/OspC family lipoprotein (plasmid) [Borrelia puertoricensis]|uniref:Vsp/OspC family lipoprotein n=1 Tax=Borrelia puertoricensis TaxID=2756107 RepID=UPI003EBD9255
MPINKIISINKTKRSLSRSITLKITFFLNYFYLFILLLIGKKIKSDKDELEIDNTNSKDKNGTLVSGAFGIGLDIDVKLVELEKESNALMKAKVTAITNANKSFLGKLRTNVATLSGVANGGVKDADAKAAILKGNATKDKGVTELEALNTAIDALLTDAKKAVEDAIAELSVTKKK